MYFTKNQIKIIMELTKVQIRQLNDARRLLEDAEVLFNKATEGQEIDSKLKDARTSIFEATRKTYNYYNFKINN